MPSLKVNNSLGELNRGLFQLVLDQVNSRLIAAKSSIERQVIDLVRNTLKATPTYQELSHNSQLTALFGFPAGSEESKANIIVEEILRGVSVKLDAFRMTGHYPKGSLTILVNWGGVFGTSAGVVITDKGKELNWIKWLLLDGSKIIVPSYAMLFKPAKLFTTSRSGPALEIKSQHANLIKRINPLYAGSETSNWITESLAQDYSARINTIIHSHII